MDMSASKIELSDVSVTAVGLGALGSQVVLNLARQGLSKWTLIDHDLLLPHNFARHGLSARYNGLYKAEALAIELNYLLDEPDIELYPFTFRLGSKNHKIEKILKSNLILDASASYELQMELAYNDNVPNRVASTYYCGAGFTSVLLSEDINRDVRIDDIDLQLKVFALDNGDAASIFKTRDENELAYATACSSRTAVMPQDLVAIHAGIIARQLKDLFKKGEAQVHVNTIQTDGYSVKSLGFKPEKAIVSKNQGWEFRISRSAIKEMTAFRRGKMPAETGGVLVGWINSHKKIIYVGKVLPAPPDSVERPYYFIRGKNGLYKNVEEIRKKSNNDLYYVGEWHSHQGTMVEQSQNDQNSMRALVKTRGSDSLPGIMIIVGENEQVGCYAEQEWQTRVGIMGLVSFDKYTRNARLMPALITFMPVCLSVASLFPDKFAGWDLLIGIITTLGLTVLLEHLARDLGKKKEPGLFKRWGGKPTTYMLRQKDSTINPMILDRYHKTLHLLTGLEMPTSQEERNQPKAADQIYEACTNYLRENTRDKEKFGLVYAELIGYGFRRNLWGMKKLGVTLSIILTSIPGWTIYRCINQSDCTQPISFIAAGLNLLLLIIWIALIKPDWVKKAAESYAQQLLASCEQLTK